MTTASLRFRVTSWYVGLLAVALLLFGLLVYFGLARYLESTLERSLVNQAESIGHNFLELEKQKGDRFVIGEVNESYAPETSGSFIRIARQNGSVLYLSGSLKGSVVDAREIPSLAAFPATPFFRQSILKSAGAMEIYALPYTTADGQHFLIETGTLRHSLDRILRSLLLTLLLLTPLILIAAALGGYWLMRQPLKPVVALTEQAERIGATNFNERLSVIATGDELERLSLSLNRMLARLEEALTHIHRFTGDVSHELRTPLTIVRGELEHVVQLPYLEPDVVDAVGSALEEIERMSRIVENLLVISRLDVGDAGMEPVRVDIQAMSCATADQMRILADEKRITLLCNEGAPVEVFGDATRLKQVIVNLLDNAIKYTQPDGKIEIRTDSKANIGILQVSDNGIGIPGDALPHVFERFYRADKARSRSSGGTGLGLSIVKAICSAHRGTVSIESVEGAGTTATVELPLYEFSVTPGSSNHAARTSEDARLDAIHTLPSRRSPALQSTSQHESSPNVRDTDVLQKER